MASSGTKQRFVKGVLAAGLGQIITLAAQLVGVPLFLHFWGARTYGEWLLLSTLPTYLQISDVSLGNAAGSAMTVMVANGNRIDAQKTYQSAWITICGVCVVILAVMLGLVWLLPIQSILQVPDLGHQVAAVTVSLLIGQIIVAQQGGIFMAAYRSESLFALGSSAFNALRLLELVTTVTVLVMHGSLIALAGWVLVARSIGLFLIYLHLSWKIPWLKLGFSDFDWKVLKPTVGPAVALNAFPIGQVMNLQGVLYVIGYLMGPVAVTAFSTARTLSRLVLQVSTALSNNMLVELSRAFGEENLQMAKALHRRVCQVGVWMCISGALVLALIGPWIYAKWTHKTPLNIPMFDTLLVVAAVNSLWNCSYAVPISVNRHQRIAVEYLIVMTAGTFAALVLGRAFGLFGIALSLLLAELAMNGFTLRQSLPMVADSYRPFIRTVFSPPIKWAYSRARSLL